MTDIGDNHELTDIQRQALLMDNVAKIERLKADLATKTAEIRNAYKVAKADGIPKKDIDYVLKIKKQDDDEVRQDLRRRAELARWMRVPVGVTPDLFDRADTEPFDEKAFNDGRVVGMAGGDRQSPYDPTSTDEQNWLQGYDEGQQALKDAFVARQMGATATSDQEPDEREPAEEMDGLEDA